MPFESTQKVVYLDNNATTMVDPKVFEAMKPYFCELYGNPSSMHSFGGQVHKAVDKAREQVKDFLGATDAKEIIFTFNKREFTKTYACQLSNGLYFQASNGRIRNLARSGISNYANGKASGYQNCAVCVN